MISKILLTVLFICSAYAMGTAIPNQVLNELKVIHPNYKKIDLDQIFIPDEVPSHAKIRNIVENSNGYVQFELNWTKDGKLLRAYGNAVVRAFVEVGVVKTPILPATPFSKDNIEFKSTEVTMLGSVQYFSDWKNLKDLQAAVYMRPGTVVSLTMTQKPYLVQKGQKVELTHEKGLMKITVQVTALENGRLFDWIRVENPSTRKILSAKVMSLDEVSLK